MDINNPELSSLTQMSDSSNYFGKNEFSFFGGKRELIRELAFNVSEKLSKRFKIAYADADHQSSEDEKELGLDSVAALSHGVKMEFIDKITYTRMDFRKVFNRFERKFFFNDKDIIFVNGNHFKASRQILILDPEKEEYIKKKRERLTNVVAVITIEESYKSKKILDELDLEKENIPHFSIADLDGLAQLIAQITLTQMPNIHGLVYSEAPLSKEDRQKAYDILSKYCNQVYGIIPDGEGKLTAPLEPLSVKLIGFNEISTLISAFLHDQNVAYLFMNEKSLQTEDLHSKIEILLNKRDSSKHVTAFLDKDNAKVDDQLSLWEPKSALPLSTTALLFGKCPLSEIIEFAESKLLSSENIQEQAKNLETLDDLIFLLEKDDS